MLIFILNLIWSIDNQGFIISNSESHNTYGTNVYFYAFGQAGISTKLSDNGAELLIGAPGVFVWRGKQCYIKLCKYVYQNINFNNINL